MKFRITHSEGNALVLDAPNITSTSTLSDLIQTITNNDNIPLSLKTNPLLLKIGFPPTSIDLYEKSNCTLQQLKIQNGEKIIIDIDTGKKDTVIKGETIGKYVPPSKNIGYFVRRKVPSDNSCLFHSLSYVLENKNLNKSSQLREFCANYVAENPKKFTTSFLGMKNIEYANWILHKDTWGGAIEVSILSEYYKTKIIAFDTTTCREDVYGSDHSEYVSMALIIYTGDHYDALCLNPISDGPSDKDITLFNVKDTNILGKARAYVQEEHKRYLERKK
ncbi:hypothetical protein ABK040_016763 [Willaertia magna]